MPWEHKKLRWAGDGLFLLCRSFWVEHGLIAFIIWHILRNICGFTGSVLTMYHFVFLDECENSEIVLSELNCHRSLWEGPHQADGIWCNLAITCNLITVYVLVWEVHFLLILQIFIKTIIVVLRTVSCLLDHALYYGRWLTWWQGRAQLCLCTERISTEYLILVKGQERDFSGCPVVKTLPSSAAGCRFYPSFVRELRTHLSHGQKTKT